MKQSDSSTSLTNLVVCDTACHFCNEPDDLESENRLVDMRKFLNCECRLTAHMRCWLKHLGTNPNPSVKCPLCRIPIAGWKLRKASEAEINDTTQIVDKRRYWKLVFIGLSILGIIIFIVVYTMKIYKLI